MQIIFFHLTTFSKKRIHKSQKMKIDKIWDNFFIVFCISVMQIIFFHLTTFSKKRIYKSQKMKIDKILIIWDNFCNFLFFKSDYISKVIFLKN